MSIEDVPTKFQLEFPIPPDTLAVGADDPRAVRQAQRQTNAIERATNALRRVGESFYASYMAPEDSTRRVYHLRDRLTAEAITVALRVCQYRDRSGSQPTSHSRDWWSRHSFRHIWGTTGEYQRYSYGGGLGSLAFYLFTAPPEAVDVADNLALLTLISRQFWQSLGQSVSERDRVEEAMSSYRAVLEASGLSATQTQPLVETLTDALDENAALTYGVTADELSQLPSQMRSGEIRPQLARWAERVSGGSLQSFQANARFLCPPAGIALLHQALTFEGLLSAVSYLNSLREDDLLAPLSTVFSWDSPLPQSLLLAMEGAALNRGVLDEAQSQMDRYRRWFFLFEEEDDGYKRLTEVRVQYRRHHGAKPSGEPIVALTPARSVCYETCRLKVRVFAKDWEQVWIVREDGTRLQVRLDKQGQADLSVEATENRFNRFVAVPGEEDGFNASHRSNIVVIERIGFD